MFSVGDLIMILETYNKDTPIVLLEDKHVGCNFLQNIDGIEEVEFKGKLAIQII